MDEESSSNDSDNQRAGEAKKRWRKWYRKRARDANFKRRTDFEVDSDISNESDTHPAPSKRRQNSEPDDNHENGNQGPLDEFQNEDEQLQIEAEAGIPDHNIISDTESLNAENVESAGEDRESDGEGHSSSHDDRISIDTAAGVDGEESEENARGDNDQHSTSSDDNAASGNENADGDQYAFDQVNSERSQSETDGSEHISADEEDLGSHSDEDISDYEQENEDLHFEDEPIFNGSTLTFKESALAILSFVLSHRLSGLCISDLLLLISLHCGPGNRLLKSLYMLKKYFKMLGKEFIKLHYYCSICETPLPRKDALCHGQQCDSYFIEFPLLGQLQSFFSKPGFYQKLQYRFTREKKNVDHLEDIYDGSVYQDAFNSGFLRNPNNISFLMYFDGVAIFKSSNFSIWPVFLTINELKYKYRTLKENTLLAGLWFGNKKPNPNVFLAPIRDSLSSLENNGVDMTLPHGEIIRVRGKLLCAVADMPAKALFMRLVQYNGAYSCFNCLAQGCRFDLGNATVQVFPYARHLELRNLAETVQFGEQALAVRHHDPEAAVYGVKGPSVLSAMLPNIIHCMGIDVMHGVFLGAMRTLMSLWFDSQYSNFDFSISNMVQIVDERLKNIKPPSSFQNMPRRMKDMARWKAFDLKMFFFYYSLVVLCGILPEVYWFHHAQLVTAISLLSQESISPEELNSAEEMLHLYVSDFQRLYGLRHLTLTFHQLLHLVFVCKNLGPTWVFSCFTYESLNGQIAKLVHGSRHVALQICTSSFVFMKLPVLVNSMPAGQAKTLCLRFLEPAQNVKVTEMIDERAGVVGKFKTCYPVPANIRRLLQEEFNIIGGRHSSFFRLKLSGLVYTSAQYVRSKQKKSCFVEILEHDTPYLCKVLSFIRWSPCGQNCPLPCAECAKHYFCFVSIYDRDLWELHNAPLNLYASHLQRVSEKGKFRIFPVQSIKSLCLYMSVNHKEYICVPINNLEVE